jgi:glycosyltransferase involved in cell wall biosynthesis
MKQFNEKYPDMSTRTAFVIITSGINSRIKREFLDISHNLRNLYMLPSIPHELLPGYLASADLLLIPYSNDQFSMMVPHLKVYEYMASGTPIVAEYTQGSAGVLEDGRNCFVADADCPRRFAEKIEYSLKNENESRGIGKEARKQAFEKYSWKRTSEIAIEAYRRILE